MTKRVDEPWKNSTHVKTYIEGIRGGIPLMAEQIDVMLRLIDARGAAVENFLDLGCGDGILSRAVLAKYPGSRGTLVDFSEPMLTAVASALGGLAGKVNIVKADFSEGEWTGALREDCRYDLVVSGYAIHHQSEQRKKELFAEIFALLAPGGLFVNIDHVSSPTMWIREVAHEVFLDSLYVFHSAGGTLEAYEGVKDRYLKGSAREEGVLTPVDAQCAWLRESGFTDVDCFFKIFELAVFGGRRPG